MILSLLYIRTENATPYILTKIAYMHKKETMDFLIGLYILEQIALKMT